MIDEEYKVLMLYELLVSVKDLSGCNYAAVDHDGGLHAYEARPELNIAFDDWVNIADTFWVHVCYMTPPEDWKDTLIEL